MNRENTYRYLFPIGCLNAILGALLWIMFRFGWLEIYPSAVHGNLMIGGFLLCYAFGFLWTAIPRFFRAPMPGRNELSALVVGMGATPVLGLLSSPVPFYLAILLGLGLTVRFGITRFRLRRNAPPPSFVFVFSGMLLTSFCLLVLISGEFLALPGSVLALARAFFLKGFVLFLVVGIGMKLIPALTGWAPLPDAEPGATDFRLEWRNFVLIGMLLLGIALEAMGRVPEAGLLYSASLLTAGVTRMKMACIPRVKSALSLSVWASLILISLSPLLLLWDPAFALHFWHLIFIGGFGLLTVFVSLRVVLAHSGQEFLRWEKRPAFFAIGGLILLAAATRVSAAYIPGSLLNHYAYAAGAWILALCGWAYYFLRFTPGVLPAWRGREGHPSGGHC